MGRLKEMMDKYGKSSGDDTKPKRKTTEEIKDKYRKRGDASFAAAHARHKLVERGEKLEKLSLHTEQLQSEAGNYSSLAGKLAKKMENHNKWWKL